MANERKDNRKTSGKSCLLTLLAVLLLSLLAGEAMAQSRIKDISSFEGVRDNLLVGYGLGWRGRYRALPTQLYGALRPLDLIQPYRL